jgi:hypothetical protein
VLREAASATQLPFIVYVAPPIAGRSKLIDVSLKRLAEMAMRRLTVLTMLAVVGCVSSQHSKYPADWSPQPRSAQSNHARTCPDISGRYEADGQLSADTPEAICRPAVQRTIAFHYPLDWLCDVSLPANLASVEAHSWSQIEQPDDDTIRMSFGEANVDPVELRRSKGDFDCAANRLIRVQRDIWRPTAQGAGSTETTESTPGKVIATTEAGFWALLAYGGVQTLTREFTHTADGALVMQVTRSTRGLTILVPQVLSTSTYVRWRRMEEQEKKAPADDTDLKMNGAEYR